MDAMRAKKAPAVVAVLGYGGLIPLMLLAGAALWETSHSSLWRNALFAYAAVILSFVGALHWAFAMTLNDLDEGRRNSIYVWSVVPAMIAWLALLLPLKMASPLLVVGFVAHYYQDSRLEKSTAIPGWYLPLRLRLTVVAIVCVAAGGIYV